ATLKERGVTVLLTTHKLREVMATTERVCVMRQGAIVADRRTSETDMRELATLMVGHAMRPLPERRPTPGRRPERVRAQGLGLCDERGVPLLEDVDLTLHGGEIV